MQRTLKLFFLLALTLCSWAHADEIGFNGIGNFHGVTPAIARSARPPSKSDLLDLAAQGYNTIIDLENDSRAIAQEQAWAKELGMNFISMPMDSFQPVDSKKIDSILILLQNPQLSRVLVHCQEGKDRTGLIVGLFRVLVQGWKPGDAYKEMLYYGFTPELLQLSNYYQQRTGWQGQVWNLSRWYQ
jgi:protein tyrosine/serine phosphatase